MRPIASDGPGFLTTQSCRKDITGCKHYRILQYRGERLYSLHGGKGRDKPSVLVCNYKTGADRPEAENGTCRLLVNRKSALDTRTINCADPCPACRSCSDVKLDYHRRTGYPVSSSSSRFSDRRTRKFQRSLCPYPWRPTGSRRPEHGEHGLSKS